ncbi:hypothetical protein BgiBS90_004093 [Biomphalaria glabrata]|nr:hypothetical protein BgiBS90_004093 [Biomphalaria glabrata]
MRRCMSVLTATNTVLPQHEEVYVSTNSHEYSVAPACGGVCQYLQPRIQCCPSIRRCMSVLTATNTVLPQHVEVYVSTNSHECSVAPACGAVCQY